MLLFRHSVKQKIHNIPCTIRGVSTVLEKKVIGRSQSQNLDPTEPGWKHPACHLQCKRKLAKRRREGLSLNKLVEIALESGAAARCAESVSGVPATGILLAGLTCWAQPVALSPLAKEMALQLSSQPKP